MTEGVLAIIGAFYFVKRQFAYLHIALCGLSQMLCTLEILSFTIIWTDFSVDSLNLLTVVSKRGLSIMDSPLFVPHRGTEITEKTIEFFVFPSVFSVSL